MLVCDILADTAARDGARPAVWFRGQWHTYAEILAQAHKVAAALRAAGIAPGDRVALFLENSPTYVAAHFGIHLAGAVEVSMNIELKAEGLSRLLVHCESRVLIGSARLLHRIKFDASTVPTIVQVFLDESLPDAAPGASSLAEILASPTPAPAASPPRAETDLATIVYTSGSTGDPKGVMLSHRNLVSNTHSIAAYLGLNAQDRMMVVLPFHYIYGRSLMYTHFLTGGSIVLDNRFAFPTTILDTMQAQAVTCFAGVPSTFAILLHKTDVRTRAFPHLRIVTQAGGGMAPAMQREVSEVFRQAQVFIMYGSTEAAPRLTYVEPSRLLQKLGSIGRAVPGVEVIVADGQGAAVPVGEVGEVAARGPNIMMGYWKDPEGTARVVRHGYYYTGDLGRIDADDYIYLTGRATEMFKIGGNRVSAKEVEDAIVSLPGIREAAVIAIEDPILGDALKAFVVPSQPGLTIRFLQQELNRTLPSYKVPGHFELRDDLPKNANGKVVKAALKQTPQPS